MRFFIRFLLLATGFSLFTFGLLRWADADFNFTGLLPFTDDYQTQGLHYLMLGLAMIPPSLWEIFNLERIASAQIVANTKRPQTVETATAMMPTASGQALDD